MSATPAAARPLDATLVTRTSPLPPDVDPLALWRAFPDADRFFWERPDDGETIAAVGAVTTVHASGPARFATLARRLAALGLADDALAVGGFAFDPAHRAVGPWRGFPATRWIVPRLAAVRRGARATLVATAPGTRTGGPGAALDRACAALLHPAPAAARGPGPERYHLAALASVEHWRRAVEATLADIAAGRLAKLVLARGCVVEADVAFDPMPVLARLRQGYPGCTVFAVGSGPATFVGASPERLVRVRDRAFETAAIAGTAARGTTPAADTRLARGLRASRKERAEHRFVVEELRARLAPLCAGLAVAPTPRLVRTEAVQHLATPVTGRLRAGVDLLDVVAALHPTPAVCGLPRPTALATLASREAMARGWYAGGVGWLGARDGEVTVGLRAALLEGRRALLHAGSGIVAGSRWEDELEETRLKLRPLLGALVAV